MAISATAHSSDKFKASYVFNISIPMAKLLIIVLTDKIITAIFENLTRHSIDLYLNREFDRVIFQRT